MQIHSLVAGDLVVINPTVDTNALNLVGIVYSGGALSVRTATSIVGFKA
jgi:hypothetical protein